MKPCLHGLRHNQKWYHNKLHLSADTKSDPDWVMILHDGKPIVRQAKQSSGRVFRQAGMMMGNPDRIGRESYKLQYWYEVSPNTGTWNSYDSQASAGDIRHELYRLLRSVGLQ